MFADHVAVHESGCGHLTDKSTAPGFVAYWDNNGQILILATDGYGANDPERTFKILRRTEELMP